MKTQYTLDNGLRVILDPVENKRKFALAIGIGVGSVHEPQELYGASHFNEHMMFKANEYRSEDQLHEDAEYAGVVRGANTSFTHTMMYATSLPEGVEDVMDLFFQAVASLCYKKDEFETEKQVILQEMGKRRNNHFFYLVERCHSNIFSGTPLGHPIAGTEETVSRLTSDQLHDFKAWTYVPANMALAVSGNFDPEKTKTCIDRTFGRMKYSEKPDEIGPFSVVRRDIDLREYRFGLDQAHLMVGYLVPGYGHEDNVRLRLLGNIIGKGFTGRAIKKLRRERGIGYTPLGGYGWFTRDIGGMQASADGIDPRRLDEAKKIIDEIFDSLRKSPISERELKGKKVQAISYYLDEIDDNVSRAQLWVAEALHNPRYKVEEIPEKLGALTSEEIRETAEKYFSECKISAFLLPE